MKTERIELRVQTAEKAAFEEAANLAGLALSAWMRERLRSAAIRELEGAGRSAAFVQRIPLRSESDG